MRRCHCHACRARDDRRFWRIVATLTDRKPLGLPPVPEWIGGPVELTITRKRG